MFYHFTAWNHDIFLPFRDREVGVLAEAVEKDDRVQNFAADDTMPSNEDTADVVELFRDHCTPTTVAAHGFLSFLSTRV